jgi:hypothetical protein
MSTISELGADTVTSSLPTQKRHTISDVVTTLYGAKPTQVDSLPHSAPQLASSTTHLLHARNKSWFFQRSSSASNMAANQSLDDSSLDDRLVVVLELPALLFKRLPPELQSEAVQKSLQEGGEEKAVVIEDDKGALVDVVAVLINQGINEMQTLANSLGKDDQQKVTRITLIILILSCLAA